MGEPQPNMSFLKLQGDLTRMASSEVTVRESDDLVGTCSASWTTGPSWSV
jgi:hypothetical protein